MPGFAIAMMVISLAATAYGAYQQNAMAQEAKKMANRNADIEAKRVEETVRRARDTEERKLEGAKARAAATGVKAEGTPEYYLEELERVGEEEIQWLKREGAWRVEALRAQGKYAAMQGEANMWGGVASGASQLGSSATSYDYYYGSGSSNTSKPGD